MKPSGPGKSVLVVLVLALSAGLGGVNFCQNAALAEEVVGTWELVAILERGVDVTEGSGVTRIGDLVVYEFGADGTFSITAGGRWFESGTWSTNTDMSPKQFDHTPTEAPDDEEIVGEISYGIYESGGGIVKICIAPDERPKSFYTSVCTLFIMRRVQ